MDNQKHALGMIKQSGFIMIIRGNFEGEQVVEIAKELVSAGTNVMEITLTTPGALPMIENLSKILGDSALVGAGSVRTIEQWQAAIDAGAQFTVAPNFEPQIALNAKAQRELYLPGVFTPTEAQIAHEAGCKLLKLFPANIGGAEYLKAVRAPMNDLNFVPTGGVNFENAKDFRQAGAFALGVGSAVVKDVYSNSEIRKRALLMKKAWESGGAK